MTMVKLLIFSNLLDPIVSLEELVDAFSTVDEIDREEADDPAPGRADVRDMAVRNMAMLL